MAPQTTLNRYGAMAAEIYDLDKPDFALPDTAFHLERFAGFDGAILSRPGLGPHAGPVPEGGAGDDRRRTQS